MRSSSTAADFLRNRHSEFFYDWLLAGVAAAEDDRTSGMKAFSPFYPEEISDAFGVLELEEAVERILKAVPAPVAETVPLMEAHGRVAVEPILSPVDLPLFDNSAMDGYAVRAGDVAAASPEQSVELEIAGRIEAGQTFDAKIGTGQCARVFTGSPLPAGTDAVVMQEDTRTKADRPNRVFVTDAVKPWENVRLRGEDVRAGTALIEAGNVLTIGRLNLLGATGLATVKVGQQPKAGLLATGSELIEPGQERKPGQIYESNRLGLATLISKAGGVARVFPLVPDNLESTQEAIEKAFEECDILVTSGGVSVGELDFVKEAFEQSGGKLEFWKVAIKPGRPFVYGQRKGKFLFGLPGNPVSALVTFLLLVRPALLRWQGAIETGLPVSRGELAEVLNNRGSRRHFMRVRMGADGKVYSAGTQASHILSSLAAANGLVDVPADAVLPAGTSVRVLRWD